jgi:DNA-binding CsgD family transcriptional regulator
VVRGEAGVGKTALLDYLSSRVDGWELAKAAGVESEMELPYSGLHQLVGPLFDRVQSLPAPQLDALATAFGQSEGPAPDPFLVGVATLSLMAEVAEHQPLLCIIDDAHWIDSSSAQMVAFVARRLVAERIAVVCCARTGIGDHVLSGLPELHVEGLADSDARTLLLDNVRGTLDSAVCDQIIAESRGNPLALLEFPRSWSATELAGGFGLPTSQPVANKIGMSYQRRLDELPTDARLLVLAAAAEPLGDPVLLHRAAGVLGLELSAITPAVDAGLLRLGVRLEFTHPLVRSTVYHAAATEDRHRVHRALADATDAAIDPDRRAWHRARGTAGPAEDIAAELEVSAGRAQARGGVAAAAAFLERSVALTIDPRRRAGRSLSAAVLNLQAGAFDASLGLLELAETGPLEEHERAMTQLVRGQVSFASGGGRDAPPLLLMAARELEAVDLELARETYLLAWVAVVFAGDPAAQHLLAEICSSIEGLPERSGPPSALDLLLKGLALLVFGGQAAAVRVLQEAGRALTALPLDAVLRWGWAATAATDAIWDIDGTTTIAKRQTKLARDVGALAQLPVLLAAEGNAAIWRGDLAGAEVLAAEAEAIGTATGTHHAPATALRLLGLRGTAAARPVIEETTEKATAEGRGLAVKQAQWAAAVLANGLGRYDEALSAAQIVTSGAYEPFVEMWALPELIEAAVRSDEPDVASAALDRLSASTRPCGTDFGRGLEARSRALLSGDSGEDLYQEALDRLRRAGLRPELARTHLLYGEWLRRAGRRIDAREQLRSAHTMCAAMGMEAFAERSRRELLATGERVRPRSQGTREQLTPQEEQIARFARDGRTNSEIGALLFLSPRTVEWHLRKVFTKLGIKTRRELRSALPPGGE